MLKKEDTKKLIGIVAFGVFFCWSLNNLTIVGNFLNGVNTIIFPFVLGACIAFILNIPMTIIEKKFFLRKEKRKTKKNINKEKKNKLRPLSIIMSFILILAVIALIVLVVIPELINIVNMFIEQIPQIYEKVQEILQTIIDRYPVINEQISSISFDFTNLDDSVMKTLQTIVASVLSSSFDIIIGIVNGTVNLVVATIFAIYVLLQKEKLSNQIKKLLFAYLLEERATKIIEIGKVSNEAFNNFITGQFSEALILGTLCCIGMLVLQIPYAVTVGIIIAFTALIPVVGAFIGAGIAVILILPASIIKAGIFIIFLIILQQIEANIIYPKVVGNSVGLPGLWVLVAITIGSGVMGIIGILISIPIASILYTLTRRTVNKRLEQKQIIIETNSSN